MKLNIVFDSAAISHLLHPASRPYTASLASLLGMASQRAVDDTAEAMLCASADMTKQADWPIAAISSLAEQWAEPFPSQAVNQALLSPQDGYWLLVHGVHFVLQRDYFTLAALLDVPAEEGRALLAKLNAHFAGDGLTFLASADWRRWYLHLQDDPHITTTQPQRVLGQATTSYMPSGQGAAKWNCLLNEVQMLLFEHPVNQARERRGEPAVNSIWLSAGGRQPVLQQHSLSPQSLYVVGDGVFVRGLGMLKSPQVHVEPRPTEPPDHVQSLLMPGMDEVWLMADALNFADAQPNDGTGTAVQTRQERWFKSLLTALRKARIEQANFYICWHGHHVCMTVRPVDSWKFWRKPKSLADVLSELPALR